MAWRTSDPVVSGEAVVAVAPDLSIVSWNAAAEELTGIPAAEALGRPCWLTLRGQGVPGAGLCHRTCALGKSSWDDSGIPRQEMTISTTSGPRTIFVSTIIVRDRPEPLLVHVLQERTREREPEPDPAAPAVRLTPRQRQVLQLLAEGVTARGIAERLGLAETTVRNHIRAVLGELGVHSQLEGVARARALGLV